MFLTARQKQVLAKVAGGGFDLRARCFKSQKWDGQRWTTQYVDFPSLTWCRVGNPTFKPSSHGTSDMFFAVETVAWSVAAELQNKGLVKCVMDNSNRRMMLVATELGQIEAAKLEAAKEEAV